jgi:hypothetical protein
MNESLSRHQFAAKWAGPQLKKRPFVKDSRNNSLVETAKGAPTGQRGEISN